MASITPAIDASEVDTRVLSRRLSLSITARQGLWLLAVLVLPALIVELRGAQTRPFWYDELCTAAIAALGTPSAIWAALARGVDTQPPFFYLVTSFGRYVFLDAHLAFRLPALIGYFVAPFCVYAFVTRRVGAMAGLVAALVPILSGAQLYASEARPYGFELGCLAVALLCWQRLEHSRWSGVALALSLTAAVGSHYYAVLVLPGLAFAETVRWYRTREVRFSAWIPIFVSVTPILIALPLMRVIRALYAAHFWSRGSLLSLAVAYSNLTGLGTVFTAGVIVVLLGLLSARVVDQLPAFRRLLSERSGDPVPVEECAIAAFFLCLPIVTFLALRLTQGGLMMRYVLPSVLGLAVSTGFAVAWLGRSVTVVLLAVLLVNHGLTSVTRGRFVFHAQSRSAADNSILPVVQQMLRDFPAPHDVVISSGVDYLPLAYYAPADARERMLTLVDREAALRAIETDSVDVEEPLLQPYLHLNVQPYSTFRRPRRRFLLFSSATPFDYWPARLSRDGDVVTLRREQGSYRLYEVELRR